MAVDVSGSLIPGYPLVIQHSYGKIYNFFMGKLNIDFHFHGYVKLPKGKLGTSSKSTVDFPANYGNKPDGTLLDCF